MKVFVLIWQGIDESSVEGVASTREAAEEWTSRSDDNGYEEFEIDAGVPVERWRDRKLFPPEPPPDPNSPASLMMKVYGDAIIEQLNNNTLLERFTDTFGNQGDGIRDGE